MDFLVAEGFAPNTAAAGDVKLDRYVGNNRPTIRTRGARLPVDAATAACPGGARHGLAGRLHARRHGPDLVRRRRGARRRRDLGADALGPPQRGRGRRRALPRHRGDAPLAAQPVLPRHAQRDPPGEPGRRPRRPHRPRGDDLGRCSPRAAWASSPRPRTRTTRRRSRASRFRPTPATASARSPAWSPTPTPASRSPASRSSSPASASRTRPTRSGTTRSRTSPSARTRRSWPRRPATTATSARTSPSSADTEGPLDFEVRRDWAAYDGGGRDPRVHRARTSRRSAAGRRTRSTSPRPPGGRRSRRASCRGRARSP